MTARSKLRGLKEGPFVRRLRASGRRGLDWYRHHGGAHMREGRGRGPGSRTGSLASCLAVTT